MTDKNNYIVSLIEKFENGSATAKELEELEKWYKSFDDDPKYTASLNELDKRILQQKMFAVLTQKISPLVKAKKNKHVLYYAAASLIISVISLSLYLNHKNPTTEEKNHQSAKVLDIAPGGNKALLTLANGKKISLGDQPNGHLISEGNTAIIKLDNGMVAYQANDNSESLMHTITTPVGGEFKLIMADGTKVWLNANSSITFPSKFNTKERSVNTTGETYFEVAKQTNKGKRVPFKVKTLTQEIEVLGTHFNINAYTNESALKTTLTEGSIKLLNLKNNQDHILKPGQQAALSVTNNQISIKNVDIENVIAWKNGFFEFNKTDLFSLMKQLERWYPINVIYEGNIKNEMFFGRIERNYTLNDVLKVLELGNVHFKVEQTINQNGNRNLIVKP